MRKKPLSLLMLLLFALSMLSALNVNMIGGSAVESPAIYIDPATTQDPNLTVGMLYTVSVKTDYTGSDVWGYQFTLTYNPSVLQGYEVTNGDLITTEKHPLANFMPGTFDNEAGTLSLTGALFFFVMPPPHLTSGPGTLANITFRVLDIGTSDITLGLDTLLIGRTEPDYTMYNIIDAEADPDHIGHGLFDNTGAQAYPPYPPVAVMTAEWDGYTNEPVTLSGEDSYDQDGGAITNYKWDFGDGTPTVSTTDPVVLHTYTTIGIYTISLTVTDDQTQVGDPTYHSIPIKERPERAVDLVKWKAKPEARHWDYSKDEDNLVTLTALARNRGSKSVDIEITFAIIDAATGTSAGDPLVATTTLPFGPEVDVPISVDLNPSEYGYDGTTKKVLYAHVTLRYDSDANGSYDTATTPKTIRFAVVP